MEPLVYLSRFFVEFGPFSISELQAFHRRGLVGHDDYVRYQDSQEWIPATEWIGTLHLKMAPSEEAAAEPTLPKTRRKSTVVKKTPTEGKKRASKKTSTTKRKKDTP